MNNNHTVHVANVATGAVARGRDHFTAVKAVEYGPLSAAVVTVVRNDRAVPTQAANADDALTLSENFNAEIDAWARQALCRSGFGDF